MLPFFNAVGMDVALPLYCGYGRYCPFTAAFMDAAFYTAVRRYVAFSLLLVYALPFTLTDARVYAAPFSALGVGVMLPILLRLAYVLPFTLLLG